MAEVRDGKEKWALFSKQIFKMSYLNSKSTKTEQKCAISFGQSKQYHSSDINITVSFHTPELLF